MESDESKTEAVLMHLTRTAEEFDRIEMALFKQGDQSTLAIVFNEVQASIDTAISKLVQERYADDDGMCPECGDSGDCNKCFSKLEPYL